MLLGWAAVAQAVPVDLLKTPVPADVACGGAVDEAEDARPGRRGLRRGRG